MQHHLHYADKIFDTLIRCKLIAEFLVTSAICGGPRKVDNVLLYMGETDLQNAQSKSQTY